MDQSKKNELFIPDGPLTLGIEAVYYSTNIEKTLSWFDNVLGWLTRVERTDENDSPIHGIAYTIPLQFFSSSLCTDVKIHILNGKPRKDIISIIPTTKLEKLVNFVNRKMPTPCFSIEQTADGIYYAKLTTIDGSILTFYQKSPSGPS